MEITQKCCYYCGNELSNSYKYSNRCFGEFKYNGIDRIDSSKGYIIDNCVPCCRFCNYMKNDNTVENFLLHIQKIASYQNSKNLLEVNESA